MALRIGAFAVLLLSGCQIENRGGSVSLLQPPPVPPAVLQLDEPVLRILEDYRGRPRLIVQDPVTRRYKIVGL